MSEISRVPPRNKQGRYRKPLYQVGDLLEARGTTIEITKVHLGNTGYVYGVGYATVRDDGEVYAGGGGYWYQENEFHAITDALVRMRLLRHQEQRKLQFLKAQMQAVELNIGHLTYTINALDPPRKQEPTHED